MYLFCTIMQFSSAAFLNFTHAYNHTFQGHPPKLLATMVAEEEGEHVSVPHSQKRIAAAASHSGVRTREQVSANNDNKRWMVSIRHGLAE